MLLPLRHRAAQHARRLRLSGGGSYDAGLGEGIRWLLDKIVAALAATGINPNLLTFLGLLVNLSASVMFARGRFGNAAALIFLAGFLDILDGPVARRQNR